MSNSSIHTKEYVERRHNEPNKFLFLPKMGSQAGNELLLRAVFDVFMGKFFFTLYTANMYSGKWYTRKKCKSI